MTSLGDAVQPDKKAFVDGTACEAWGAENKPGPAGPQTRFLSRFKSVLGGTGILQFSKFLILAAMAGILSPVQYGYFQLFIIAQNYLSNSNLGVLNALNRNLPLLLGQQKFEQADLIKRQALLFTVYSSLVFSAGILVVSCCVAPVYRTGLIANATILSLQQLYFYNEFVLKAEQRFRELGRFQRFFAFVCTILCLLFGLMWKANGAYLAYFIAYALVAGYAVYVLKVDAARLLSESLRRDVIRGLLTVGFPIMVLGFSYHLMLTLDRFIILHFYSIRDVGYYSLMNIVNGIFQLIAMSMATVLYPEIMNHLGAKKTYLFVFKRLTKFILLALAGFGIAAGVLLWVIPPVVRRLYPEYTAFLGLYKWLMAGIVFLNLNFFNSIFICAFKKTVLFIVIQMGIVLAAVGINIAVCQKGHYGLNGVAYIFMGAAILNFVISYIVAAVMTLSNHDSCQVT